MMLIVLDYMPRNTLLLDLSQMHGDGFWKSGHDAAGTAAEEDP